MFVDVVGTTLICRVEFIVLDTLNHDECFTNRLEIIVQTSIKNII